MPITLNESRKRTALRAAGIVIVLTSLRISAAGNPPVVHVDEPFKGWVNIASSVDPAKRPGINYSTIDYSHATIFAGGNTQLFDKANPRTMLYEPGSNTIFISNIHPGELHSSFEDSARRSGRAVSRDAVVAHWKEENPDEDLKIERSTENGLERYVVTFAATNRQTFWFDPKTNLLSKVRAQIGDKDWMLYYRYNAPVVREIYDLGVPRDAKIVDNRPGGELKTVLDRIDAKIDSGFGDCVAVLSETPLDAAGKLEADTGRLHLFAQQGSGWLWHEFLVGKRRVGLNRTGQELSPALAMPAGWPLPDPAKLIGPLAAAIPNETYVSNGTNSWRADFAALDERSGRLCVDPEESGPDADEKPYFSLAGRIWQGSYLLEMFQPRTAAQLKRDPARPGQVGIVTGQPGDGRELWIDPARDDVPVEYLERRTDNNGHVGLEEHSLFQEYAQLPNGRWYPTRWTHSLSYDWPDVIQRGTKVFHLQIDPKLRLGPKWFGNPVDRVGSTTMPITLASPPPTTSATQGAGASIRAK